MNKPVINIADLPSFGPKSQQMLAQAGSIPLSNCANRARCALMCR